MTLPPKPFNKSRDLSPHQGKRIRDALKRGEAVDTIAEAEKIEVYVVVRLQKQLRETARRADRVAALPPELATKILRALDLGASLDDIAYQARVPRGVVRSLDSIRRLAARRAPNDAAT